MSSALDKIDVSLLFWWAEADCQPPAWSNNYYCFQQDQQQFNNWAGIIGEELCFGNHKVPSPLGFAGNWIICKSSCSLFFSIHLCCFPPRSLLACLFQVHCDTQPTQTQGTSPVKGGVGAAIISWRTWGPSDCPASMVGCGRIKDQALLPGATATPFFPLCCASCAPSFE